MANTAELKQMIAGTVAAFPVDKERTKALKAIQWRLRGPRGEFVGLSMRTLDCAFVDEMAGYVFDGQDNEDLKLATYERVLGPLTIEVLA